MNLSAQSFFNRDFSDQDLRGVPMHHSKFVCCRFDRADMSGVDASHSEFVAGSMNGTKCTHTNFMNTQLALIFAPSDCLGMTLTLSCRTFKGMSIKRIWWFGWLYFAYQMKPLEDSEPLHAAIKKIIGDEIFERLDKVFRTRQV